MARSYSCVWGGTGTQSATVAYGTLTGAATVRPKVYDILVGSDATPADNAAKFVLQRSTATGTTPTTVTPAPIDPGDPSSLSSFASTWATAPSFTLAIFQWAQNQRATFRWVAAPTKELVLPNAANAGLNFSVPVVAGSAVNWVFTLEFEE